MIIRTRWHFKIENYDRINPGYVTVGFRNNPIVFKGGV